jgi:hypothetical protein
MKGKKNHLFDGLRVKIQLYREISAKVNEEYQKKQALNKLASQNLDYNLLQDMINAVAYAPRPVEIPIMLADGTSFKITPKLIRDRQDIDEAFKGTY